MKKILIVGNYNVGNFGDDLILLAIKKSFSKFPDCEFKIMGPGLGADYPLPPAGLRSFFSLNLFKSFKGIKWSNFVVFGGGGIFNPEEKYSLFIWGNVLLLANLINKPVMLIGQSFSPVHSRYLGYLLKIVDFITVRDSYSLRNLSQYKLKVPVRKCSDLALLLDSSILKSSVHRFEHDKFIVLNLREYKYIAKDKLLVVASSMIDFVLKHSPFAVYLVPFDSADLPILKELKERYRDIGRVFNLPHEKSICFAAIEQSKGVISERLHVGISALICCKPLFILSYSSKVIGLFKDLVSPLFIFDLETEFSAEIIESGLVEFTDKALKDMSNFDVSELAELKNKSLANLRLVKDFIDGSD